MAVGKGPLITENGSSLTFVGTQLPNGCKTVWIKRVDASMSNGLASQWYGNCFLGMCKRMRERYIYISIYIYIDLGIYIYKYSINIYIYIIVYVKLKTWNLPVGPPNATGKGGDAPGQELCHLPKRDHERSLASVEKILARVGRMSQVL